MLYCVDKEFRKSILTASITSRFLPQGWKKETVALVSYPRSGNSFLRRALEKWSGTITGSDSRPNRTLSSSLLRCGFRGEGVTDDSVWLVKTHYPERMGFVKFVANRAVLIIRNPFDTIESYFHMGMTNTHDKSLSPSAFNSLDAVWDDFIINEIKIWKQFYLYWLQGGSIVSASEFGTVVTSKQSELLVIRYEDLLLRKEGVLSLLFSYLGGASGQPPLGVKLDMEGASCPHASTAARDNKDGKEPGYQPRQIGSVGKSLHRYSKSQLDAMKTIAGDIFLDGFGYSVCYDGDDKLIDLSPINLDSLLKSSTADFNCESSCPNAHGLSKYMGGRLVVNSPYSLRPEDDPFGRKITYLRKSFTKDDTEPFETV